MKEGFKYVSEGGGKRPRLFIGLFFGLAVVSLLTLRFFPTVNPVFFQVVLLLSLLLAIYIFVRFIASLYVYEVLYEEDRAYFLVIQKQGRRLFTKCKLPLVSLGRIVEVTPDSPQPSDAVHPIMNYSSVMMEDSYTLLEFTRYGQNTSLRIHANAAFMAALREAYAAEATAEEEDVPLYDPATVQAPKTGGYFSGSATSPFALTEEEIAAATPKPREPKEEPPAPPDEEK